jgi:hypothetical protein
VAATSEPRRDSSPGCSRRSPETLPRSSCGSPATNAKRCNRTVDIASFRDLGEADSVDHGLGLCRPFVLHTQTGHWRVRQGVERTLTGFATIARQRPQCTTSQLSQCGQPMLATRRCPSSATTSLPGRFNGCAIGDGMEAGWLIRRRPRTAAGNVHAPRQTGLDVIAIRSLGKASVCQASRRCCGVSAAIALSQPSNSATSMVASLPQSRPQ